MYHMRILLFGRSCEKEYEPYFRSFFKVCKKQNIRLIINTLLNEAFKESEIKIPENAELLTDDNIPQETNFVFSIGGDGTFLRCARLVQNLNTHIVGINTGRLGFLADTPIEDITKTLNELLQGNFTTEKRSILKLDSNCDESLNCGYALNDISVLRSDTSSLIVIHVYIDEQYLNSYWADGLIISTPTGSTAYNMSAGGPIVLPNSDSIIITPIAPHSLTVRPLVIPDSCNIRLKIESRSDNFLVSVDSQSIQYNIDTILHISKAEYMVQVAKRLNNDIYQTLRNKLMWGQDKRNN